MLSRTVCTHCRQKWWEKRGRRDILETPSNMWYCPARIKDYATESVKIDGAIPTNCPYKFEMAVALAGEIDVK